MERKDQDSVIAKQERAIRQQQLLEKKRRARAEYNVSDSHTNLAKQEKRQEQLQKRQQKAVRQEKQKKEKQKKLFEIEKKVILDYANSRNCVIVGRCADYVLRSAGKKKLFNVFIYAPYSARYNFCVDRLGLTPEATADYMDKINKARADFYKKQTGERFDSPKYRHMMIDSSCMKMSDIIDVICSSAEKSFLS